MKKNLEDLQLKELIHVAKELIPKDTCKFVIDSIKDQKWESTNGVVERVAKNMRYSGVAWGI